MKYLSGMLYVKWAKLVSLPNNVKTKISNMLFTEKIKELRIQNQMPQRQIAAALDIDTATYCKIEKGERKAKKEQVVILSEMFHVEITDLLTLWLADKVTDIISDEQVVASEALFIAAENLKRIG
ncbi:helix-turn-helix domain-containing protein [Bacteroides fragilis]|uniref:helix-turn-helix domain-containing protein n=3 Tax=Bacteroidales TaxID=171549 RepID=UPI002915EAC2|nr:helix-turn-helix transcriptional regulator [Bacteroides fragilis]MDV3111451.1 helix-turn-helix transcriptional regulator [Bacteroides fragilis]